jgi:ferritin
LAHFLTMAERVGDGRTSVFLDPMVRGQIDAENVAAHLLDRVRFARQEAAAILLIDREPAAGQHAPASVA